MLGNSGFMEEGYRIVFQTWNIFCCL